MTSQRDATNAAVPVPTGTVTFLFTDIEGSTRLWENHPDAMRTALARHDALLREAITRQGGHTFKTVGDAFCAAFSSASDALAAALDAQQSLQDEAWPEGLVLRVRVALHTGAADTRDGDYFGPALNRVARLLAIGHGGQTLLSQGAAALCQDRLPLEAALEDRGKHYLRDLAQPEQVFQLCHPALPAHFAPLRSLSNPELQNNLPQQTNSFIGRDREMGEIRARLETTRLLTLAGTGGAGKTRIALQTAADLLDGASDGVWLVELAGLSDPGLVPQAVASALGVAEEAGSSLTQTLTHFLKPRRLLLLLDNCEHVLLAAARIADTILKTCPGVTLLATSREGLNIAGEVIYRVPPLTLPPSRSAEPVTPDSLLTCEAARLFVDRATQAQNHFAVTRANASAVARLCVRLDGVPLALELAAARVRSLPVEEINLRLDNRFRLLTGGSRAALPRQQTLRALVDWSYDLLSPAEKDLLAALSVFAGGWTLHAAEAVCTGNAIEEWEILDILTSLVDKSLVITQTADDAGTETTRYNLLETMREYAGEKMREAGEKVVRKTLTRHRDFFLAVAETSAAQSDGPEQGAWLRRLDSEQENFRAALAFCQTTGETEAGLRLAAGLSWFWTQRCFFSEGRSHLDLLLRRADAQTIPPLVLAHALRASGLLHFYQNNFAGAQQLYEQSLPLFRAENDTKGIHNTLKSLGSIQFMRGNSLEARRFYEESLHFARSTGSAAGTEYLLSNLGVVAQALNDYAGARMYFEESLSLSRAGQNARGISTALSGLGYAAMNQKDYPDAARFLFEALEIRRALGDKLGMAETLRNLGEVVSAQGDYAASHRMYTECLALCDQIENLRIFVSGLLGMGDSALCQKQYERAARLFGAADALLEHAAGTADVRNRASHEPDVLAVRAALGDAAFVLAYAEGHALNQQEALAFACASEPTSAE